MKKLIRANEYDVSTNRFGGDAGVDADYVTAEDLEEWQTNDLENAEDMKDLQDIIWSCPDGILEDDLQHMYNLCESDGDDLETAIGLLSSKVDEYISTRD